MKLLNFTIIKLALCLILGILIGFYCNITLPISSILSAVFLIILFVIYYSTKNRFYQHIGFGVLSLLFTISIGILTVNLQNQKNHLNHYTKHLTSGTDSIQNINFSVKEVLKSGQFYKKYIITIHNVNGKKVSGKSLLNVKKDTLNNNLKVDDNYLVRTEFKNLIPPLNPGQFDYKKYLEKQYIYHQLFIDSNKLLKTKSNTNTIFGFADSIREHVNSKLEPYNFKKDELAIINALLLGQRQDITKEIYTSYTNAGAIHILAVSGLHVGIILLILNFIFKPLERFKNGKYLKTFFIVILLWSFAIIAGLSPSVTRAVTMFSIVAIGMNLKRPTNIYNTLAISIFFILLFKPLFLFDVGFQLSYLAVFAIVTLDPILYKLWQPKNWILDTYWHTFTITIAAQFGIIPLSLFYFHQFPILFFISNLVIIPFLGLILALGLLVILLSVLNLLPQLLANLFEYLIGYINSFVSWIAHQENFLITDISFGLLYVIASYVVIIYLFKWYFRKKYSNFISFLIAIIFL